MPGRRITLRTIAQMAGVSETTASMCLNGKAKQYHISEETCQRLMEVIRRVNYQPNVNARAMARKRTDIIGYVMRGSVGASFWAEILSGIDQALAIEGFHLLPIFIQDTLKAEIEALDFLVAKGVDACIWVPICSADGKTNAKNVLKNHKKHLPIMTLTHLLDGFHGIEVDDDSGGVIAAKYLWDKGHRRIAVLGDDLLYSRSKACRNELRQHGIEAPCFPDLTSLMKCIRRFTAVFCFSDIQAFALYKALLQEGLKVPDDVSVIGYDNMFLSDMMTPALTTINQPKEEFGSQAGKYLLDILDNPEQPIHQMRIEPTLIERASVRQIVE